jgi:hypothetical protein
MIFSAMGGAVEKRGPRFSVALAEIFQSNRPAQILLSRRRFFTFFVEGENSPMEDALRSHLRVIGVCDSFRAAILF